MDGMNKYVAELLGTATPVLIGCGSVVLGGYGGAFPLGMLPVALAFGLAIVAMAYAIGPISGRHVNPAVTISMFTAGRMGGREAISYIVAQLIGGIVGALAIVIIVSGKGGGYDIATAGLGQNGWGAGIRASMEPARRSSPNWFRRSCSPGSSSGSPRRRRTAWSPAWSSA